MQKCVFVVMVLKELVISVRKWIVRYFFFFLSKSSKETSNLINHDEMISKTKHQIG